MSTNTRRRWQPPMAWATAAGGVLLLLGACTSSGDGGDSAAAPAQAYTKPTSTVASEKCGPATGITQQPGTLTISTDPAATRPWFEGNDPGNGKGFEGAVAQAVSQRLGYKREQVTFVGTPFKQALSAGPKSFDFAINQATITSSRRENIDFSSPYYAVTQAAVTLKRSRAAQATSLAGLSGFKIGASAGTTSLAAAAQIPELSAQPVSYPTIEQARSALSAGKIDVLITDLPTAFEIAASGSPAATLIGQLPRPNDVSEFLGLVLRKGSPMTSCVSTAVDSLYADGTLDRLARQWLTDAAGAKILR